ncbi:putative ferric-chelate reductase 1 [Antennarius striatus]|uniref:putative ferric-chelate reductase 1 n=1 Tax=Antennarius striatus TaxID=241820 RepID=UPI0035AF8261
MYLSWDALNTLELLTTEADVQEEMNGSRDEMSLKGLMLLLGVVCVCCVEECVCFPNGSVAYSCGSMMPGHPPYMPSTSSPPFTLSTSGSTYRPGGVVSVMVEVEQGSPTEFRGFMLQARSRKPHDLSWSIGTFINVDTSLFTLLHCNNMKNSTVSQASGEKRKKVQLSWKAPSNSNYGDIYFSASLVQDYTTFWVRMNSSTLKLETSGAASAGMFSSSTLLIITLLSAYW